jgi:hypothetical protein
MRDGVWARSRTSKMLVSARSRSWSEKSRVSAAVVEVDFVADEDVTGLDRGGGDFVGEAVY